jgi:hypothetical protein
VNTARVGGPVVVVLTVIDTEVDVFVAPSSSWATAVSEYVPAATLVHE